MANIIVYYLDCYQDYFGRQFLHRERDLYDDQYVYTQCPVFNHKTNRTFVGFSPIDISLKVDKNEGRVLCDNDEYKNLIECDEKHLFSPNPVIQLSIPQFLFWTDTPNVWFEYKDHPMTSLNNNFIGVGGWFNLSNWPRNTTTAFTVIDEEKPVIIKKGDPLFRVSFYPQNLDSGIILKKINETKKIQKIMDKYSSRNSSKSNWKSKLFSKTNIKTCPFKFLYDK